MSTTMAFVRMLSALLKDRELGARIVPIIADEARTFGMADLFRTVGIYSPVGQLYEPEDQAQISYYKEAKTGQILEEGINEAGAIASWVAAGTSYSTNGFAMLPFYIFYSMFGFQRVGDLLWAAADSRTRGFLLGATAGRTTLSGEGLQHQDGTSQLIASTIPNCRAYDPVLRVRAGADRRRWNAAHAVGAAGCVLLRHGDERELRAAVDSRRMCAKAFCAACTASDRSPNAKVRLLGSRHHSARGVGRSRSYCKKSSVLPRMSTR